MTEDEVVREVRAARDAFAASHAYDIRAMVAALRELGVSSGRQIIQLATPAVPTPNQAPKPPGIALPVPGLQTH